MRPTLKLVTFANSIVSAREKLVLFTLVKKRNEKSRYTILLMFCSRGDFGIRDRDYPEDDGRRTRLYG